MKTTNKTTKTVQLTPALLRSMINEEVEKLGGKMEKTEDRAKDTEETEADELADSTEKHIDFMKALKIEEGRLVRRLGKVRESLRQTAKKLTESVKA